MTEQSQCGCRVKAPVWQSYRIIYCPLHAKAGDLLAALESVERDAVAMLESPGEGGLYGIRDKARAAIAEIKEES